MADLLERVGKDGTITLTDGSKLTHEVDVVKGMKLDQGYISPYFSTNPETMKCEFEDPLIFITDQKISNP